MKLSRYAVAFNEAPKVDQSALVLVAQLVVIAKLGQHKVNHLVR